MDSWTATKIINAPKGRYHHTAIWTGSEMVVWGGSNPTGLNTGGRYCAEIWFADAYSNTNCNSDTKSHTDFASSSVSGSASVKMLISDLVTNVG